jgi:hypothetical protein
MSVSMAAIGVGLVIWRRLRPRQSLVLDLGDRRLIMQITGVSAPAARALVPRIQRTIASADAPLITPTLLKSP